MKLRATAVLCIASLAFTMACANDVERRPMTGGEVAEEAGLGLGSFLASAVYAPVKLVYATGGLIAGGLAWMFSGGDSDVAMGVIEPAVSGDYVITPERLRNPASIEFIGRGDVTSSSNVAATRDGVRSRANAALPAVSSPPPRSSQRIESVSVDDVLSSCSGTVTLDPIRFAEGSTFLNSTSKAHLAKIPFALNRCPGSKVRISGHTDAKGTAEFNMALSGKRADAIRAHLLTQGVEASRLEVVARGEGWPAGSNKTSAGRATNRRAEIALVVR